MRKLNNVRDIAINKNTKIDEIFSDMLYSGGFQSKNLANGVNILSTMISDKKCLKFLSFVGSIISTGVRGVIKDMIKNNWFDAIITTCGALDHDIARYYTNYKEGEFMLDDKELYNKHMHRLGNILIPMNNYGLIIENKMQLFLKKIYNKNKELSTADITNMLGKNMGKSSFLYWAYKNNIPVFVPGIMDGAVGTQIWFFIQKYPDFKLNITLDSNILSKLVFKSNKSGAFMIGGGISKHHTLWWNQYKNGLNYAVYVTTADEFDGSSSGALVDEAVSWGKVSTSAKYSTIHTEATIILPFIYSALLAKL